MDYDFSVEIMFGSIHINMPYNHSYTQVQTHNYAFES